MRANPFFLRLLPLLIIVLIFPFACSLGSPSKDVEQRWWSLVDLYTVAKDTTEICPIHRIKLEEDEVLAVGGMPSVPNDGYAQALVRYFPYSRWYLLTGTCIGGDMLLMASYCEHCRSAEYAWRRRHKRETKRNLKARD